MNENPESAGRVLPDWIAEALESGARIPFWIAFVAVMAFGLAVAGVR